MKLTPQQRQQRRERFAGMSTKEKLEHIWLYYKAPILLAVIAILILGYTVSDVLSRKEPIVHVAFLNVSAGEDLESRLSEDFLTNGGYDTKKSEVLFYRDLYLSDSPTAADHEYAYTSKLKVMATIHSKQLDLVLMNQEAYDLCSASGYLLDLTTLLPPDTPNLTSNQVVLSDNAVEFNLGQAEEYLAETIIVPNALELTQLPLFRQAGFSGNVYLGIIANTPRLDACTDYIAYLLS